MKMLIRLVLVVSLLSQSMGMGISGLNLDVKDKLMMETLFYEGVINKNVKEVLGDVYTDQLTRKRDVLVAAAFQEILRVIIKSMRLKEEQLKGFKEERLIKLYKNLFYSLRNDTELNNLIRDMANSLIRGFEDIIIKYIEGDIAHHEGGSYTKKIYDGGWKQGKSKGIIYGEDVTEIYGDWDIGVKKLKEKARRIEVRKITGQRSLKPLSAIVSERNRVIISERMVQLLRKISIYMSAKDYERLIDSIYRKYIRGYGRRTFYDEPAKDRLLERFDEYKKKWDVNQYNEVTEFAVNGMLDYSNRWPLPLLEFKKSASAARLLKGYESSLLKRGSVCIELFDDLLNLVNQKSGLNKKVSNLKEESLEDRLIKNSEEITNVLKTLGNDILRIYNTRYFERFDRITAGLAFLGVYGKTEHAFFSSFPIKLYSQKFRAEK